MIFLKWIIKEIGDLETNLDCKNQTFLINEFFRLFLIFNYYFLQRQISYFCELFPCDCLAEYVQPVTFTLALDKIAEVRITAIKAVSKKIVAF